jgi:hypothetical protein
MEIKDLGRWFEQTVRNRALNGLRSWKRRARREDQAATETPFLFESHPGQRRAQQWRALSVMLAVMTGILAVAGFGRPSGYSSPEVTMAPAERELAVSASDSEPGDRIEGAARPPSLWSSPEGTGFLGLRERLMNQGLDALPTPAHAAPSPDVPGSLSDWFRQTRSGDGLNLSELVNGYLNMGDPS